MENPSRLEVNWRVLSDEMVTLKTLKDQAVKQMDMWLQNVLINESRVEEIGSGGFGIVYKGEFPSGEQIAVKVLTAQNVPDELFMEEVRITGMASHPNLIKLYGFCCDSNMRGLVYEYMENGSLDRLFYKDRLLIEWDTLYDIMIHTADGVSYLHDGCKERIVHHDIKPANILLGSKHFPKVADFGLAKHIERDLTHFTVSGLKGTPGYVAPEMTLMPFSHVTYKCDVYSFGMMLFDVLGMSSIKGNDEWFPEKVWKKLERRKLNEFIEDCGIKEKDKENAEILSMVAFWCIQFTPDRRPCMSTVVKMLKKEVQVEMPGNPFLPSSDPTNPPSTEGNEDPKAIVGQPEPTDETISFLIKCMIQHSRVYQGKPVAAYIINKCLLHWNSDEIRDDVFRKIITAIKNLEEKDCLPYWLSNTSMLEGLNVNFEYTEFASLLYRGVDTIYSTIRDNLKKDIKSLLSYRIWAPTTSVSITSINNHTSTSSWVHIVDILDTYLRKLQENFVSSHLIKSMFADVFHYINVELFNSLMLHRECCSFGNGENLEAGLSILQSWCAKTSYEYAGSSWEELARIRVATAFLVKQEKFNLKRFNIKRSLLGLNNKQKYTLCTHCWDEKNNTNCVTDHVLLKLHEVLETDPYADRYSLFLDCSTNIRYSVSGVLDSLKKVEFSNVTPDIELVKYHAFQFLKE